MIYYGIFPDGNFIAKPSLNDLTPIPGLEYFIKAQAVVIGRSEQMYTLINADGTHNFLRVGDFELRDIGSEFYDRNIKAQTASITLFDYKQNITRKFMIITNWDVAFLKQELVPLLKKLDELGSYEMYLQSLQFDELKRDNLRLREKIKSLESELAICKERQ